MTERNWTQLKSYPQFEITVDEPFLFRRKGTDNQFQAKSFASSGGKQFLEVEPYKHVLLHRILAIQFIPNPNNYKCVEHINGNVYDNSLLNLRWASQSMISGNPNNNCIKPGETIYMTELPEGYEAFTKYKKEEIDDLFVKWENSIPSFIQKNRNKMKKYNTIKPNKYGSCIKYHGITIWFDDIKPK
jgi:hypothetical protein